MIEGAKMPENEFGILYAAAYSSVPDAEEDFEGIKLLHKEKWIGKYESALFTKNEDGSVKILDTDATGRARGAKLGAAIGVAVGLIFPVTILAGALAGGGIGLLGGHLTKGLTRGDIKELGDTLDEGEAGIVLLGIVTPDEGIDRFLKRAAKVMKKQVDAEAEELKKAIDESVK
jgi:uncharacterized membrane protein